MSETQLLHALLMPRLKVFADDLDSFVCAYSSACACAPKAEELATGVRTLAEEMRLIQSAKDPLTALEQMRLLSSQIDQLIAKARTHN